MVVYLFFAHTFELLDPIVVADTELLFASDFLIFSIIVIVGSISWAEHVPSPRR